MLLVMVVVILIATACENEAEIANKKKQFLSMECGKHLKPPTTATA